MWNSFNPCVDLVQNATVEERVALLEIQVVEIEEDVTGLDQDVNFLFEEQIIQDERLLNLEEEINIMDDELESEYSFTIKEHFKFSRLDLYLIWSRIVSVGVLATTITLDFRVTAVEEAVGRGGNSTVAELEVRVETLEGTAADHETRISATESDLTGR